MQFLIQSFTTRLPLEPHLDPKRRFAQDDEVPAMKLPRQSSSEGEISAMADASILSAYLLRQLQLLEEVELKEGLT